MKNFKYLVVLITTLYLSPIMGQMNYVNAAEEVRNFDYQEMNAVIDQYVAARKIELDAISKFRKTEQYMLMFNTIMESYSWILDKPETIYDVFSEEEINKVCAVVEAETKGGDFLSKVNVASVIFNRYQDSTYEFPDDLLSIVTEKNQFSKGRDDIEEPTILAVEYAYTIEDTTFGALWFNVEGCNSWASRNKEYLFTDEAGHEFYR